MPNIVHFMIPADNVERARTFYSSLLGWQFEQIAPNPDPGGMAAMQYHMISTGKSVSGTLNGGGYTNGIKMNLSLILLTSMILTPFCLKLKNWAVRFVCRKLLFPASGIPQ